MEQHNQTNTLKSTSDDEEDLEALRLAALQSLKRKNEGQNNENAQEKSNWYNRSKGHNKRGRFFGGRGAKNQKQQQFPPFNGNRARNSNLISIPTLPPEGAETDLTTKRPKSSELILPQDRYNTNKNVSSKDSEEEGKKVEDKFSRYDDKSDSEEDEDEYEEESVEEEEEVEDLDILEGELKRADSLEALMQELDDEIQGKSKPKEKEVKQSVVKVKKVRKKKKKVSESHSESEGSKVLVKEEEIHQENSEETEKIAEKPQGSEKPEEAEKPKEAEKQKTQDLKENLKPTEKKSPIRFRRRSRSRSPRRQKNHHRNQNYNPNYHNQPFAPPPQFLPPYNPQPHNMNFPPPPLFHNNLAPFGGGPYDLPPPLPLLSLNLDIPPAGLGLPGGDMGHPGGAIFNAPLSPRSARFVMENRKIIEKRKRSPRRSYSRSPSPLPRRRSKSPRRSLSPLYPRRKSLSPRRQSLSPRKSPTSNHHHNNKKPIHTTNKSTNNKKDETSPRSKPSVRERLGLKKPSENKKDTGHKDEVNKKDTKKDDGDNKKGDSNEVIDPVLEARKKKFENKEIKVKEGIIRLKKDEENHTDDAKKDVNDEEDIFDDLDEDLLLGDDDKHIFSDEESNSENEGRFKAKENATNQQKVPVLSFTQLVNGTDSKKTIPDKPLIEKPDYKDRQKTRDRKRRDINPRKRSPSPLPQKSSRPNVRERITITNTKDDQKPKQENSKITPQATKKLKTERKHVSPPLEKRFERKIEIKIKNPSKYEKLSSSTTTGIDNSNVIGIKTNKRKVEIDDGDNDPQIIVENEDDEDILVGDIEDERNTDAGDLRAQLSKKRAERLHHKSTPVEGNTSRLLQNALQGAVFKATSNLTKKSSAKEKESILNDGKLPIHLRLGLANSSDFSAEAGAANSPTKSKRKSKKGGGRNRSLEQDRKNQKKTKAVYEFLDELEEEVLEILRSLNRKMKVETKDKNTNKEQCVLKQKPELKDLSDEEDESKTNWSVVFNEDSMN